MDRTMKKWIGRSAALVVTAVVLVSCGSGEDSNRNRNSALPTTTVDGTTESSLPTDSSVPTDSTPVDSVPASQSQVALSQTGSQSGDEFGGSVVMSADGTTLAVAALQHKSQQGAVTVFARSDGKWVEEQVLIDAEGASKDWFGYSMALSANGSTLAIGAVYSDAGGKADVGSVSVYSRDGGKWALAKKLDSSTLKAGDIFGVSVALSTDGNTLAVGASGADSSVSNSGAVYMFVASGGEWSQKQVLSPSKPAANQNFGASVSLSMNGDVVAVGGPNGGSGQAFVFSRANGVWS